MAAAPVTARTNYCVRQWREIRRPQQSMDQCLKLHVGLQSMGATYRTAVADVVIGILIGSLA